MQVAFKTEVFPSEYRWRWNFDSEYLELLKKHGAQQEAGQALQVPRLSIHLVLSLT
ncbi:hypothetical protein [Oryza sativa Japonica Group]|uniref:Uncharacterized protein n=1 Tax=Oryza sativa subsp. japonica TaxID=39947 RepID=Q5NAQ7_ORYSJ|nr:hypothetical protein [Oryza sativa Japonica Group]BAD81460.1 hypothetical protein [Oryza sativa Japonica Group]